MTYFSKYFIGLAVIWLGLFGMIGHCTAAPDENWHKKSDQVKTEAANKKMEIKTVDLTQVKSRELIIKLKHHHEDFAAMLSDIGAELMDTPPPLKKRGIFIVRVNPEYDFDYALAHLRNNPLIANVEPNFLVNKTAIPDDEYYPDQWYLPRINAPAAWDLSQGSPDVLVAVLDTGVDYNHPDLADRIWKNSGEGDLEDGIDNDNNGYIDDIFGYCTASPGDPAKPYDPMDDNIDRHGTRVAGIIAASTNNSLGIAGVDWNCKILPVKVLAADGYGTSESLINGIYYAMDQGADIINMSLGSSSYSAVERDAIWEAYNSGIILIAASGNNYGLIAYPAAYMPVISVGAADKNDQACSFSNYGSRLDIMAPGKYILSSGMDSSYQFGEGTSFAAPIVSGVAALLLAQNPALDLTEIEWVLEYSADMPEAYSNQQWVSTYGYGRVNAEAAINSPLPDISQDAPAEKSQALPIRFNIPYHQELETPQDDDWFCFELENPGDVSLTITPPPGIDVVAWLEAPPEVAILGWTLQKDDPSIMEKQIDLAAINEPEVYSFDAEPGTYYLHVYDYNGHWSQTPYEILVNSYVAVSGLSLNENQISLVSGGQPHQLTAALNPDNASKQFINWESDRPDIAEVADGWVTAHSPGTAIITAASDENSLMTDSCVVNVISPDIAQISFQGIILDHNNQVLSLAFGENIFNNTADIESLKAAISLAEDGVNFNALGENDTAAIEGNILKITLSSPLNGENNHVKIEAKTLRNEMGDSLNEEIIAQVTAAEGCFIATAAYGSYLDPHVWTLRQFRDNVLLNSTSGRWFVAGYYQISPPIAAYIAQHEFLRMMTRLLLTPLIIFIEYPVFLIILLLFVFYLVRRSVIILRQNHLRRPAD